MRPNATRLVGCVLLFAARFIFQTPAWGQALVQPLIVHPVDEAQLTVLKGNTHPLAQPQFDQGAAPPNLPMERMLLVLKRSPEQEAALRRLLDDQQDKASPNYHKWLTPEQFGAQFGPADQDIQIVTSWLQTHGFQIAQVAKGRTVIEFSGTAGQVQEALHTAIRKYVLDGEEHWANANDPQIPSALTPVVAGVHTLHNFLKKPMHVLSSQRILLPPGSLPQITGSDGSHALVPGDYAVIYNINPVYGQGIRGDGMTIAVVARSDIDVGDFFDFRSAFGLSSGTLVITPNGSDPGIFDTGEQAEATLDVSWSGAIAPDATVNIVPSASTNTTDGVDLSELYIVDNDLGDVMTESFGTCEANPNLPSAEVTFIRNVAEQAAAQGITYMVSSGDTGSAGCDNLGETQAQGPPSVNLLASTPFHVAVGGTIFNEHGQGGLYWSATNDPTNLHSARSYIPENVWNETCTGSCPDFPPPLSAGGGGASILFGKPSWQSGVAGIPNDGARDVPDVSLTAAGHDGYLLCLQRSCASGGAFLILGTSASAPSFAGIMALVDQKMNGRQGQANYVLYRLAAAETLSQCNASKTTGLPASNCVFNDVTVGNDAVPGESGYGTSSAKYQSTVGYDLATGLGSVNVANLVNAWNSVVFRPTTTTLVLSPTTNITHGHSVSVIVSVAPNSGSGTPSGDVALLSSTGNPNPQHVDLFPLSGGSVSSLTNLLPGGTYNVTAHYAGDATFASSDSAPVSVMVSPEASSTIISAQTADSAGHLIPLTSVAYGSFIYLRADVAGQSGSGFPSGTLNFWDNGTGNFVEGDPYSLNSQGNSAPPNGLFRFLPGPHAVTAAYDGDASFKSSTSAPVNFAITQAPTTSTLQASPASSVTSTTAVTLSITINTHSGGFAPDGTATFFSGGTSLGSSPLTFRLPGGPVQGGFVLATSGATLTTTLPTGSDSITAQYSGDTNYVGSTSPPITVNVQADFSLSAGAPSVNIASPGGRGTIALTITGQTGYNSTINFSPSSCSNLPPESSCSFNPPSITGSGTTTITVTTMGPHAARRSASGSKAIGWWTTSLGVSLAGVFLLGVPSKRRRWSTLLSLMVVAVLLMVPSCGGGNSNGGGGGGDPGTPVGSRLVTVTATSGSLTHTTTFTLNVQ